MVHLSHCTGSFPILDMSWWRVCQVEGGVETEYQSRAEDGDGQRQQLLPGVGDGPGGGACTVSCTVLYCILYCTVPGVHRQPGRVSFPEEPRGAGRHVSDV